jgi:hypothetical protein
MTHAEATRGNRVGIPESECSGELVEQDRYFDSRMTLDGRVEREVRMLHCRGCATWVFTSEGELVDVRVPDVNRLVSDLAAGMRVRRSHERGGLR